MTQNEKSMNPMHSRFGVYALPLTTLVALCAALLMGWAWFATDRGEVRAAYSIANSARFNRADGPYLSRLPGSAATNRRIQTYSFWFKHASAPSTEVLFSAGPDDNNRDLVVMSSGNFGHQTKVTGTFYEVYSSAFYRDPAAWQHFVVSLDMTQATAANRVRLYVDGKEITSFSSATYPPQNTDLYFGDSGSTGYVGALRGFLASNFGADGYLSDVYFIDGQALTPSSFGETDANGYWRPKAYTGTYGTNGLKFAFGTGSNLGDDTSSNNNDWTVNAMDATDQVTDTPTNSFATWSPLAKNSTGTLTNGNLLLSFEGNQSLVDSGFGLPATGKWYWEIVRTVADGDTSKSLEVGIRPQSPNASSYFSGYVGSSAGFTGYAYRSTSGNKTSAGTDVAYGSGWSAANDLISVAYDADNNKIWFAKNGTWQASGDPDSGTNAAFTTASGVTYVPSISRDGGVGSTGNMVGVNFGQGGTTTLTYDSTAGGYFYYPPTTNNASGFKALSTANLPVPTIAVPKNYFDAMTYTGSGTATSTWSGFAAFQPNLVWIKNRTDAASHALFDAVRGVQKFLSSDSTAAEDTDDTQSLSSFNTNGFSLGTGASTANVNTSGKNYISWMWKESPTSGFDIVTYTGDGTSNRNISHLLDAAPQFVVLKSRSDAGTTWWAWHTNLTGATYYLEFNGTAAQANTSVPWGTGNFSSTQFMVSGSATNVSSATYVAYLFKGIEGFSKFGSYTGNAAADGPFVYTGFKPRYVMIKSSTAVDAWLIYDTARNTYNVAGTTLVPNTTAADATISGIDFLSNGFKLRTITTTPNAAQTYIYAAFAEQPFYYSAQPASVAFVQAVAFLIGMSF